MRYIFLILFAFSLFAEGKPILVIQYNCVEINGEVYHGSPDSTGQRYNWDGLLTYEFDKFIRISNIFDQAIFDQAKKLQIKYWEDGWHTKNLMGKFEKPKRSFPLINKKEKKK